MSVFKRGLGDGLILRLLLLMHGHSLVHIYTHVHMRKHAHRYKYTQVIIKIGLVCGLGV